MLQWLYSNRIKLHIYQPECNTCYNDRPQHVSFLRQNNLMLSHITAWYRLVSSGGDGLCSTQSFRDSGFFILWLHSQSLTSFAFCSWLEKSREHREGPFISSQLPQLGGDLHHFHSYSILNNLTYGSIYTQVQVHARKEIREQVLDSTNSFHNMFTNFHLRINS